jgi:hypothetical protein
MAQSGEKPLGESAPEDECRRQWFVQKLRGPRFQAARRGNRKRFAQVRHSCLAQFWFRLIVGLDNQMPSRG